MKRVHSEAFNITCNYCLEDKYDGHTSVAIASCNHGNHLACTNKWLKSDVNIKHRKCSQCRQYAPPLQIDKKANSKADRKDDDYSFVYKPIVNAIRVGDLNYVRQKLSENPYIAIQFRWCPILNDSVPLILLASYSKNDNAKKIMKVLIKSIANISSHNNNARFNDETNKLLLYLVRSKKKHLVKLLIKNKVDINTINSHGDTALHISCNTKNASIAKLLIDNNTNINVINFDGNTPLHIALHSRHTSIIKLLIDNRANVNLVNFDGDTPLHMALHSGHISIIKLLIDNRANVNMVNSQGSTALHIAIHRGSMRTIKYLINNGNEINLNATDNKGNTLLHLALITEFRSNTQRINLIKFLVEKGANINLPNSISGDPPLHTAIIRNHTNIVKFFIINNHDFNIINLNTGNTSFDIALKTERKKIINVFKQIIMMS